jgi:uncharacterized cupredoxin-like copper-binding protein
MRKTAVLAVVLLALAGCGGDGGGGGAADAHDHAHEHSHDDSSDAGGAAGGGFAFGAPGRPSAASRTVEVVADDPYRFEPAGLEVEPGETVTFVVTNEGDRDHEFVLGDEAYQDAHGEDMAAGGMHHEGNAVTVAPGATEQLTWTFPAQGVVLYGCHVAGHYDAGMVGAIRVSA